MGGGNNEGTGYATGGSESDKHTGIRMDGAIVLNSGGGDIQLKGKSYALSTNFTAFGVGFWDNTGVTDINSSNGKITIDGFSNAWDGATIAGIFAQKAIRITSADTTENAIRLIGKSSFASGEAWGLETDGDISVLATGNGGGITISTSQRSNSNYDIVLRGQTNILAKSGPVRMLGGQSGGNANGIFYTGPNPVNIGSNTVTAVTSSSSDILIQYDRFEFFSYPKFGTSGAVSVLPTSNSFGQNISSDWFQWNQYGQTMDSLAIGKPSNTLNITMERSPITVAGPIGIYGGYVAVNTNLTSTADGDIFIKGSNNSAWLSPSYSIIKSAGQGTLTMQGYGQASNGGNITANSGAMLNVILWSDYGNENTRGSVHYGTISTNGGHVWMGGSNSNGGSSTWNGLVVGNGPSVGSGSFNNYAIDFFGNISTSGGDVFVWGGNGVVNGILADGDGCTVNTGTGDVTFIGDQIGGGAVILNTTGKFTYAPDGGSFPAPFIWNHDGATNINLSDQLNSLQINNFTGLSGVQLGYYDGMAGIIHNNTSDININKTINIPGPISIYGGNITLNDSLSTTNTTTGDILINGTSVSGTRDIRIAAGKTATFNLSGSSSFGGVISGTNSKLLKTGAGLLTLTNDNIYSGSTNINEGNLQV
jgi:autotransporter-associated beta strand protein